ncbi:MAG: hypothetical protein ACFFEM_03515, partial [Candidatus Thorarchaeota archaeon]
AVDRTWTYDGQANSWTRRYPVDAPPARINTGLAFDPENNVTILFGGMHLGGVSYVFQDTWTYSYETNVWTNVTYSSSTTTTTAPTPSIPSGSGFETMLLYLIPSAMVIGAAVVMVILIQKRKG